MTLIGKAAYLDTSACVHCGRRKCHIVCVDDTRVSCHSKHAARVCTKELIRQGFVTEAEKPGLLEQIERCHLPEFNNLPSLYIPSDARRGADPLTSTEVAILNTAVDSALAADLTAHHTSGMTRH